MVAVQVRDKYGTQLQRREAITHHLSLHTLARINQKKLLVDVHDLCRGVSRRRGLGRGVAEYGYRYRHAYLLYA